MATIPNQVVVHITQTELAQQLEELALQYEEVVQTLRWQAENLRSGFDLTLDVRATQVSQPVAKKPEPEVMEGVCGDTLINPTPEELDGDISDEEVAEALGEPQTAAGKFLFGDGPDMIGKVGLKPKTDPLPEDAIRLIDEMTKTNNKGEEE
ncbi:hypothetical protein PBI_TRISCUIT_104 [Microbacterium phage Triscuit]|nr:hypothetical protein PBI_TRISCUIT_104 [Microbacterium phage Triscuit]